MDGKSFETKQQIVKLIRSLCANEKATLSNWSKEGIEVADYVRGMYEGSIGSYEHLLKVLEEDEEN